MRFLRKLHLYLGCLFAPMLIFLAITGTWQLFNYHKTRKDGSYTAPPALVALSEVHLNAHVPPTPGRSPTPLRFFMVAAALGLVTTSVIGVVLAFRFSREPLIATLCLFAGVAVPGLILLIYR